MLTLDVSSSLLVNNRSEAIQSINQSINQEFNLLGAKIHAGDWGGLQDQTHLLLCKLPFAVPVHTYVGAEDGGSYMHVSQGRHYGDYNYTTRVDKYCATHIMVFDEFCAALCDLSVLCTSDMF